MLRSDGFAAKGIIATLLAGGIIAALTYYYLSCPCDRMPGSYLRGEVTPGPISDWSFVNDREAVPLCQIEVQRALPHSVNINCMSVEGRGYLSCARCEGKTWSSAALENPAARLRAAGRVHPVTLDSNTRQGDRRRRTRCRLAGAQCQTGA